MKPAQIERTPFADLDRQPREMTTMLLAALEEMGRHPEIRRVRNTAMQALRPAAGWRVLDAGSGAGDVARWIATEVGPAGEVIALDYSAATIAAAVERHDGSNVRYTTGDVSAIDLPSDNVDGVWCERVLQHIDDADLAIAELIRVTRPGGRVCLIDTDWSSLAFDGVPPRLARTVVSGMHGRLTPRQVDMGRTLRRRLVGKGLSDVSATPVTCVFGDPASAAVVLPMVNPMVPEQAWMTAPGVREKWFSHVDEAGARGDFLAVLTIWAVAGTVA
ncbi:methyltransferase domain-containing protein [Actinoplanes sp. LDG1-06]|uniref:Methyltransferase domain-containing protein n=1 Tax=Paractinoplanes ovalisporus TaxID=2810368 RepID=A0ABS2AU41_9ACTN|nr:methyltransferase domain-containing protein [Actinoplanes ovalisporus]MBM2622898.1 methyltransferase domain-containing protein [Actinoplanes ovalisporus]